MDVFKDFCVMSRADFLIGGQWGSEGKGAAAAALAKSICDRYLKTFGGKSGLTPSYGYDIMTTNAGAQAGHTSTHNGKTRVVFHLPTAALIQFDELGYWPMIYINAGAIIDPDVLLQEIEANKIPITKVRVHPNAAIITDECREAEGRSDSGQTKIASTRKGVGEALSRKVLRTGKIALQEDKLQHLIGKMDLNKYMSDYAHSVLVEVPQGLDLSVNEEFYPYCTSRNCTIQQAMSDANIHPDFVNETCLVLRTFPIRVGNIMDGEVMLGNSGPHYPDQVEWSWEKLGVKPEITTVTKRVRRVFTFSEIQLEKAILATRPGAVYVTFLDYLSEYEQKNLMEKIRQQLQTFCNRTEPSMKGVELIGQNGPTTNDFKLWEVIR